MLRIKKMKEEADAKKAAGGGAAVAPQQSPGELRIQKDAADLSFDTDSISVTFPNPDDLMNFKVVITPEKGSSPDGKDYYVGGQFIFTVVVPPAYPHEAPKVHCDTPVYHPNIDTEGNVCLNILREEWTPVNNVLGVVHGLQFLFLEPNPDDPLNKEAAEMMTKNESHFRRNVAMTMRGGRYR